MKRLSFFAAIEIALGAAAAIMFIIFLVLVGGSAARQKAAEGELLSSIDDAVALCDNFENRIDIDEELRPYVDIYKQNIAESDSIRRKAYYANILLTYVQNRVNMNNPKTLLELSRELGTAYETDSTQIATYEGYVKDIDAAFERFHNAEDAFNNFDQANAGGITEITEYNK